MQKNMMIYCYIVKQVIIHIMFVLYVVLLQNKNAHPSLHLSTFVPFYVQHLFGYDIIKINKNMLLLDTIGEIDMDNIIIDATYLNTFKKLNFIIFISNNI